MRRPLPFLILALAVAAILRLCLLRSIPPGLHYDLATNVLIGSEIAFDGYRPVFITAFTGREVLFYYALAPLIRALGPGPFTLHLAGSFLGLLSVPAAFFAVRHVLAHDRNRGWLAALTAALLAANLWHVLLSRLGYRLITEPLVQALALGFIFWGLRILTLTPQPQPLPPLPAGRGGRGGRQAGERGEGRAWLLIALGGAFTGLAAHTYLAARAFPIPLAAAWLVLLVARPRAAARPFVIFSLAALAVFAPLGWFFYSHPETFFTRIGQVAPGPGDASLLWQSTLAAFKMIFISGDPYLRFNVPFQPILSPLLGGFWIAGLIVGAARLRRARTPVERAAETLLLAWTPSMLLPAILAVHEIFPSNVRAIGLIPLVFVPAARGVVEAVAWLQRRWPAARPSLSSLSAFRSLIPLVSLVVLLGLTLSTAVRYFAGWGRSAEVYRANDADLAAAARWLNEQAAGDTPVFMSAIHYRHPTVAVLSRDYDRLRWFTGGKALAIPAEGPAVYVFPHSAPPPPDWLAGWESALAAAPPGPDGEPDFEAYRFDDAAQVTPLPAWSSVGPRRLDYLPAPANFGNLVELLGYRPVAGVPGDVIEVDLFWRVLNPPPVGDYRIVADLVDAWGFHWAQGFNDSYPSEQWRPGETVVARVAFATPPGMPPGDYPLEVTFFAPSTGEQMTAIDSEGRFAGAIAPAGPITVSASPNEREAHEVAPAVSSDWRLGPLALLGYDPPQAQARPGEPLRFALYWQASTAPRENYTLTTALVPAGSGQELVLESGGPAHDTYPTDLWASGEIVVDRHSPRLPRDLPPGEYNLRVMVMDPSGNSRAALAGRLEVQPISREFAPPAPAHPMNLPLGGVLSLAGYDLRLEPGAEAQTIGLTLYWQALAETEADYTVYVHLLGEDGQIAAQRDVQPRENSYPTSLWAAGEYVSDEYTFSLPSGAYTLAVGMYLQKNGETLGEARIGEVVVP